MKYSQYTELSKLSKLSKLSMSDHTISGCSLSVFLPQFLCVAGSGLCGARRVPGRLRGSPARQSRQSQPAGQEGQTGRARAGESPLRQPLITRCCPLFDLITNQKASSHSFVVSLQLVACHHIYQIFIIISGETLSHTESFPR